MNSRSQLVKTDSNVLLLDYYNANPSSIEASIKNFATLNSDGKSKIVLLGGMRELGHVSDMEHTKIVRLIEECNFQLVYLVGSEFDGVENNKYKVFPNSKELNNFLKINKIENSFVLVKGSRGVKMEEVLESLNYKS